MPKLHIFNPSHDEALAAGSPFYYPTSAARTLAHDLSALPAVWAAEDDLILLPDHLPAPQSAIPAFIHENELTATRWETIDGIIPWGWDALVRHRMAGLGAPSHLLPPDHKLEAIRQLSSRQTAVSLLPLLREDVPATVGRSCWCTSINEVWQMTDSWGEIMLKAPWSGSGRGVFRMSPADRSENSGSRQGRVLRILREQGAIEAEPFYHRVADLAMEFRMLSNGHAVYEGLSLFTTTPTGGYAGNLVASEATLLSLLPPETHTVLEAVRTSLLRRLPPLLDGHYQGLLGVDMMLVRHTDLSLRLHPCVEINLRRTMGAVAVSLRRLLPSPAACALFTLRPTSVTVSGAINLTPGANKVSAMLTPASDTAPSSFFKF